MKKFILFILLLLIIPFVAVKFIALPRAEQNIITVFEQAGFKNVTTDSVNFSLDGLSIDSIALDKDGFNKAENIKAKIAWPKYIIGGSLNAITINTLNLSTVLDQPKDMLALKKFLNSSYLEKITEHNIKVQNLIIDVALPQKALRFSGNFESRNIDGQQTFKGELNPEQHEISFKSKWSGKIAPNKDFFIESIFDGLSVNTPVTNIKRGTGFLNFSGSQNDIDVTAQFDAGTGDLLNVPLQNISFILKQSEHGYPATLRAQAAQIKDVKLFGDFYFSEDVAHQNFDLALDMDNPNQFISHLSSKNILKNANASSISSTPMKLTSGYNAQDRFANGPLPFDLKTDNGALNGTFLVYPKELDVRGTAQGDFQTIKFIQTLFNIDDSQVSDGNIRFDENLKSLF